MVLGARRTHNSQYADAANDERVRHERAMAAPRHGLGAHESGGAVRSEPDGAVKRVYELRRLHVVRETAETRIAPAEVNRIAFRVTQALKIFEVNVTNPGRAQRRCERIGVELRIAAGFRNRTDVHDLLDAMQVKYLDEFADRARGVPDGENGQRRCGGN